jgi:hypothetical protein
MLAVGTAGQLLQTNGVGAPTWVTPAVSSSGLTLLSTVTASASATVDIESTFDSTYDVYMLVISGMRFATSGQGITLKMKIGGSYVTTGYAYHTDQSVSSSSAYGGSASANNSSILLGGGRGPTTASNISTDIIINIYNPTSTAFSKLIRWQGVFIDDTGATVNCSGAGSNTGTDALTGIRIAAVSGNVTSGSFRLYGLANS